MSTASASVIPGEECSASSRVRQGCVLDGTIRDNLRLAEVGAYNAELWRALAAAELDDTVAALPERLDTP